MQALRTSPLAGVAGLIAGLLAAVAVYVAPAGVPHHLWAKDGAVTYQEGGAGPTGNAFLAQATEAQ